MQGFFYISIMSHDTLAFCIFEKKQKQSKKVAFAADVSAFSLHLSDFKLIWVEIQQLQTVAVKVKWANFYFENTVSCVI